MAINRLLKSLRHERRQIDRAIRVVAKLETPSACRDLISRYGEALAKHAETYSEAYDSQHLPATKAEIKAALRVSLDCTSDPELIRLLENGYLLLAMFQDGVGDKPISPPTPDLRELGHMSDGEVGALARRTVESGPLCRHWSSIVDKEMHELYAEVQAMRRGRKPE